MRRTGVLVLLSLAVLVPTAHAQDQDFLWATKAGGTSDDGGQALAVDALGNVVITGSFRGTADFDGGPDVHALTAAGSTTLIPDVFVLKLDKSGAYVWAGRMGGF